MNVMTYKKSFGRRFLLASPLALLIALGSTSCTKPGQTAPAKRPRVHGAPRAAKHVSDSVPSVKRCSLEANAHGSYDFPVHYSTPTELPGGWQFTQDRKLIADDVGGDDLVGGNLLVSTRGNEKKLLLQLVLLPAWLSSEAAARIRVNWPKCSQQGRSADEKDDKPPAEIGLEDEASAPPEDGVSDTPRDASTILPDADWYFVSFAEAGVSTTVTMPPLPNGIGNYSHCQEKDKPGASTVILKVGESHSIQVADSDACSALTTKKVYLVASDALAFPKDQLFKNPVLSPLDDKTLELRVDSNLGAMDALRHANTLAVHGSKHKPFVAHLVSFNGTSLTYKLEKQEQRISRDDFPLEFHFDSAALRLLTNRGGKKYEVFRADGTLVLQSHAELPTLKKVLLPTTVEPAQVAPAAPPEARIPLDPKLSLFVRDGMKLSCVDSSAKPTTWPDCVVIRQDSAGLWAIINKREARDWLNVSERSLRVPFVVPPEITSVITPDGAAPTFEIGTYTCRYNIKQLTRVMAGVDEAQVLYLVEAHRDGCLNRPLVFSAADAGAQLAFVGSEWFSNTDKESKKILKVSLGKIANSISGTKMYPLQAHQSAGGPPVEIEDGKSITLMVENGNDEAELTVDVEVSPEYVLPRRRLENQPFVGVGLRNELYVPSAFGDKPWRVRLNSTSTYKPELPSAAIPGALIRVPLDDRALPRISDGKGWRYSFKADDKSDSAPPLRAELNMAVADLLVDWRLEDELELAIHNSKELSELLGTSLNAGNKSIVLPAKARRYWLPMELQDAGIVCGGDKIVLTRGQVTQALATKEYNGCKLVIPVNPAEQLLTQSLVVSVATEGAKVKNAIVNEILTNQPRDNRKTYCAKLPSTKADCRVFDLDPLLGQLEDPSAYTVVKITVAHQPTKGDLSQAYVPIQGADDRFVRARNSTLTVSTRIMPCASKRLTETGTWGLRGSLSFIAGVSGINMHPGGYGVETSTSYAKTFRSQFDYGAVLSAEMWDFSANDVEFPFAPQLMVGVLGPKEAKPTFSKDISFVGGLGFRVPTATSTATGPFVAGTSLIVWYAGHWGGRSTLDADGRNDTWVHSLLFGANVSLGASP